ncbi:MAG: PaaX domain-containing protein, C- domain protein [Mycobacteriaceae bacterium]|nr:PaaX domain-containing protein, C- domain protein [Mycobacteriaceae bacterium]
MTARSVMLSVLLGAHPAWATAAELLRLTGDFGLKESTVRVALTRLVGTGDLVRSADGYRLSDRLLARQRRQDEAMRPHVKPWDGTWTTLVITSVGVEARTRAILRTTLRQNRFGELREGVWLRPDNLEIALPTDVTRRVRVLRSRDGDSSALAQQLWDLPEWQRAARRLLDDMANASDTPGRFVAAAGMVRHLLTDPVLPAELLPPAWPAQALRESYLQFADELAARRDTTRQTEVMEAKT